MIYFYAGLTICFVCAIASLAVVFFRSEDYE